MKYRVILEDSAQEDLEGIVLWIAQFSERKASQWYWQVREAIDTLEFSPRRCSLAPENDSFPEEIRHLAYGKRRNTYRVIFTIRGRTVHVLHIRHGARQPISPESEKD